MKKTLLVVLSAVVLGVVACGDSPTAITTPGAQFELVNSGLAVANPDVFVYATFFVDLAGGETTTRVLGAEKDEHGHYIPETANFPVKGKSIEGECIAGKWYNSQNKPTAGSIERPHPHCVEVVEGVGMRVVLEQISAQYKETGNNGANKFLVLAEDEESDCEIEGDEIGAKFVGNNQKGCGTIVAWGVKEGTIDRVGHFEIDLTQFDGGSTNLFNCSLDPSLGEEGCLNKEITATYRHGINGQGDPEDVDGFVYWINME